MRLDDAFNDLHAESMNLTNSIKASWLLSKDGQPYDLKYLCQAARRLQDHLDMIKGLTSR